jgi:hypothetical protein
MTFIWTPPGVQGLFGVMADKAAGLYPACFADRSLRP